MFFVEIYTIQQSSASPDSLDYWKKGIVEMPDCVLLTLFSFFHIVLHLHF